MYHPANMLTHNGLAKCWIYPPELEQLMSKPYNRTPSPPTLEFMSCKDCDMYGMCRLASNGEDANVTNTLVKRRFVLRRGEYLYRSGDTFHEIYAVRHGSIKTYIYSNDGRTQITGFHGRGEIIGLDALNGMRFASEAIVLETTNICEISFPHFLGLSRNIPDLQDHMLAIMSHAILRGQQMMLLLGKKNATERLATYLMSLSRHIDKNKSSHPAYKLTMSRRDIANYLGLTQETVCRILARFQEDGIIKIEGKYIYFVDMDRLANLTSESPTEQ
ncbi:helix-turn-helix domain-containing protein [Sulfuriferula multivorans]|nr:helix-turn-helix domain-containing protein [Sulfuriferula multivorans]